MRQLGIFSRKNCIGPELPPSPPTKKNNNDIIKYSRILKVFASLCAN